MIVSATAGSTISSHDGSRRCSRASTSACESTGTFVRSIPAMNSTLRAKSYEVRPSKSRPNRGLIKVRTTTRNQNGEAVQVSVGNLTVPRRREYVVATCASNTQHCGLQANDQSEPPSSAAAPSR